MAKLGVFRRIVKEDFKQEDQVFVNKLLFPINQMFESLVLALNKGLTFEDNVDSQIRDVTTSVDASGVPIVDLSIPSTLRGQAKGLLCLSANNLTDTTVYPTTAPFINFIQDGKDLRILHITGLQASNTYQLKLLIL